MPHGPERGDTAMEVWVNEGYQIVDRLRYLSHPSAEAMSDYDRINAFIKVSHEAADMIEILLEGVQ